MGATERLIIFTTRPGQGIPAGAYAMYDARMTTVTLATLLAARDESLAVRVARPAWLSLALRRVRGVDYAAGWARVAAAVVLTLAFCSRHGLVLGALAAFVIAAATFAPAAAWIVGGVSLLFLEVRRR